MGPNIDFLCKLYYQGSQCHVDIHLFELENGNYHCNISFQIPKLSLILTGYTTAVRISCKSRWTFTVGPMIVYCTVSTRSTRVINTTRVDTSSVSAGLAWRTFIITRASNFYWSNWEKNIFNIASLSKPNNLIVLTDFITANHTISCVAFKTSTTHGSGRSCRMNPACCMGNTRWYGGTGINTSVSTTRLVAHLKRWTIHIYPTILFFYHWFRYWWK